MKFDGVQSQPAVGAGVMKLLVAIGMVLLSVCSFADDGVRERVGMLERGGTVEVAGQRLFALWALPRFYQARGYERAWTSQADREALLVAIRGGARDGLNPDDYHREALESLLAKKARSSQEQVALDLLLSDSFLLLGSHLLEGKVNPETLYAEWVANRRSRAMESVLAEALEQGAVSEVLEGLRPSQAGYRKLLRRREQLAALVGRPWPPIGAGPAIAPGVQDTRLVAVRSRLRLLGDLAGADTDGPADSYSESLVAAVRAFQSRHGLEPDGVVGRETLAALNIAPEQRLRLVDLNLERWRWLPDRLGTTHVMVNIAGFEYKVVRDGEVVLRNRAIVGRPYRRTPVFSDQIRYLVFNPTWTVPRKLMVKDKLPEIIRDADYLERYGFTVYETAGDGRRQIDPRQVDWKSLTSGNFPYQLVQKPGPQNALGQVKFMFPNKFDVYLHDTPSRDLFDKTELSFSSGCVRVREPLQLARVLLADQPEWSAERIQEAVRAQLPVTVNLKRPVPVHLEYWTAWVDDDDTMQFRKDIYDRDDRLWLALKEPAAAAGQTATLTGTFNSAKKGAH